MQVNDEIEDLKVLSAFAWETLKDIEDLSFKAIRGREAYLLGVYVSAIANVNGFLTLAEAHQYRVSQTLLRTIYELWVNTRFIYTSKSFLYVRLITIISEREKLKRFESLMIDGHLAKNAYEAKVRELDSRERYLKSTYKTWPDLIPGVIKKGTPSTRRDLKLLDRCKIIDFYNSKYHRVGNKDVSMEKHYKTAYYMLSGGPHGDPAELSSAFKEKDGVMNVNIDGSEDHDAMVRSSKVVFGLFYEIIGYVRYYILKEHPASYSEVIQTLARDRGLIK